MSNINSTFDQALALRISGVAGDDEEATLRVLLAELLHDVWYLGESFDAKEPWGSDDWKGCIIEALVEAGFCEGTFTRGPDGERWDFQQTLAEATATDEFMASLIAYMCGVDAQ